MGGHARLGMMDRQRRRVPIAPPPSSTGVHAAMRGNKRSNTRPEIAVRKALHALGYRFRLHARDLPGQPDIIFRHRRRVIFVHGCFWHQHPDLNCPLRSKPRANASYWDAKLARNSERDAENLSRLAALGWDTIAVWECEIADRELLRRRLVEFLGPARSSDK
jgi:DNA mismatch endonuclease (patch repair protein)